MPCSSGGRGAADLMPPLPLLLLLRVLLLERGGEGRAARLQLPPQLLHLRPLPARGQSGARSAPREPPRGRPPPRGCRAPGAALTWPPAGSASPSPRRPPRRAGAAAAAAPAPPAPAASRTLKGGISGLRGLPGSEQPSPPGAGRCYVAFPAPCPFPPRAQRRLRDTSPRGPSVLETH